MNTLFESNMDMWQPDMLATDDRWDMDTPRYLNLSTIDEWILTKDDVVLRHRMDVSYDVRYELDNGKIAEGELVIDVPIVVIRDDVEEIDRWGNKLRVSLNGGTIFNMDIDFYAYSWAKEKKRVKAGLEHNLGFNPWIKLPLDLKDDIITRVMSFLDSFEIENGVK